MLLRRGDIVLVPFPFTDLSGSKVRPALIISADPQTEDLVLAFISSVVPIRPSSFDYVLRRHDPSFPASGLKLDSVFKGRKLITLHHSHILRHLGHTDPALQFEIDACIGRALGLQT